MIALLSAQIEAGARAFAKLLVNLLPFLPDSLVTNPEPVSYTHLTLPTTPYV